jgi:adenosine deaminase
MSDDPNPPARRLTRFLTRLISETNGLALRDTIRLALRDPLLQADDEAHRIVEEFDQLLSRFRIDQEEVETLLAHPFSTALFDFFKAFPLPFRDEHIHLTGSLAADFIFPHLRRLLEGPHRALYERKITEVYGADALPISSVDDVDRLIRLQEGERFDRYLKILYLPKLILTSREIHREAAYHMATRLFREYNVGAIRLKFTLFRETTDSSEQIPGIEEITPEDVVLGLYEGFKRFQDEYPPFRFILSPSFRKEAGFFDAANYPSKRAHFNDQVRQIVDLIDRHPFLRNHLREVDTVGNERGFHRKIHFQEMRSGFRKLQSRGFRIRSHHGETWKTLRQGIQAVDNAMNIWHVDAIEHGLSLGINPNHYYHHMLQEVLRLNRQRTAIEPGSKQYEELMEMEWNGRETIRERLFAGEPLDEQEVTLFTKTKFHHASDIETYQHDVLNRMIDKRLSLIALPSSNKKLTGAFEDDKDHPFSWWEKKGLRLGVGTDNYVTLNSNYIREMMILLYTDSRELKITKLLIVTTGESRRPHLSHLLWTMRKEM